VGALRAPRPRHPMAGAIALGEGIHPAISMGQCWCSSNASTRSATGAAAPRAGKANASDLPSARDPGLASETSPGLRNDESGFPRPGVPCGRRGHAGHRAVLRCGARAWLARCRPAALARSLSAPMPRDPSWFGSARGSGLDTWSATRTRCSSTRAGSSCIMLCRVSALRLRFLPRDAPPFELSRSDAVNARGATRGGAHRSR
jgi:hypothetical protein